jgi:uncharacterized membrane protein YgcG
MKGRWFVIILLIGLLLLLLWNVRERFGPTPQIRAPNPNVPYGDDVLESLMSFFNTRPQLKGILINLFGESDLKFKVRDTATRFYNEVYVPATSPITMQNVVSLPIINNSELPYIVGIRGILKRYFVDQSSDNPPIQSPDFYEYDITTENKFYNMITPAEKQEILNIVGNETNARRLYNQLAVQFYNEIYVTSTVPITEQIIDLWVPGKSDPRFDATVKSVLKQYFITPPTSQTSGSGSGPSGGTNQSGTTSGTTGSGVQEPTVPGPGLSYPKIYNDTETQRIYNLLTPQEKSEWSASLTTNETPTQKEQLVKMTIKFVASAFYWHNYKLGNVPSTVDGMKALLVGKVEPGSEDRFAVVLKRYFVDQGAGSGSGGGTGSTGGTGTGGTGSAGSGGNNRLKQVFGPLYTGIGEGGAITDDSSSTNRYPELLGGGGGGVVPKNDENNRSMFPTIGGLAGLASSRFFPFSRTPGDMEKIPDPYRVSQSFMATNYSFKTDPVPFLTDFSAFFK